MPPLIRTRQIALACALMTASGFAALAYQIVWTQQSTSWLGHESAAVLAVVGAFFGGLALGSLLLSSRIERSAHTNRWYAACEIVIGVWSLALGLLLSPISNTLLAFIGPDPLPAWHGFVAFCGTFALLLPATTAMGATLPAMERVLTALWPRRWTISTLYAANTFGAVLGVLVSAFWLVPHFGLVRSTLVCACLNLICGLTVFALRTNVVPARAPSHVPAAHGVLMLLAATGLLGIGYEVLVVRMLSQVAENTVYTFAILLAVYLIGTTLGAALYARWLASRAASEALRDRLLQALAVACLFGLLTLALAKELKMRLLDAAGHSMTSALAAEAVIAFAAFLLPTILMGALFSHLSTAARASGIGLGRSLGVNTLGAAIAPLLFGVLLVPLLGSRITLLLVAIGYLALVPRCAWKQPAQWVVVAASAAAFAWGPRLTMIDVPEGGRLVSHTEGMMGSVSVVEDAQGTASLHINNRQQEGSSATLFADGRQGLLPILLHPAPQRALFLGVGTGLTAASAAADPTLRVDAVELVPEVLEASRYFEHFVPGSIDKSRLRLVSADARRFVRTSTEHYDVIVADNFHPARSGSGSLYTVEHFASVRTRLAADGVFCQWLPLHQLDLQTLRSIVRSFVTVYPRAAALLATNSLETPVIGLVARRDDDAFDLQQIRSRLTNDSLSIELAEFGIDDELALLGSFIAGPHALERFASDAPLNTDDRPIVAYRAPRITYAPDSLPSERLLDLLDKLDITAAELFTAVDPVVQARLTSYWEARDRFIEAGRNVVLTSDVRRMVAQVRAPLLDVLRLSPDFRPAYDPLLQMAIALGRVDVDAARALLRDLQTVQPLRAEAAEALHELSAASR
jgi:spermidine synthase